MAPDAPNAPLHNGMNLLAKKPFSSPKAMGDSLFLLNEWLLTSIFWNNFETDLVIQYVYYI
ncbi:hypothetical protein ACE1AT_07130 [Pelatocladus sp. BLCC-F211]|uniref:hypothetical protein n=1 Tax=Pelatocladus sp. BLCC-F211 TaxID=3342752 RepID=UPI0035B855AF